MTSDHSHTRSRGVLTLAYGHERFLEQARSLAHSLQLHAPHLPRTLVTDSNDREIRRLFTSVIPCRPEYGSGVRQKLSLDRYSPYPETLFIDSDCLVLGNLDSFWAAFSGSSFGVPGFRYLQKGATDPWLDVDFSLESLGLAKIPKFNGGAYYFNRSREAAAFFKTARNILENWREYKLAEFRRDGPGDEAVYALAMAIHNIAPTSMGAGGMWTPVGYKGALELNALGGTCSFEKEGMKVTPEIVHFPGEYVYCFAYARERARLKALIENRKTPIPQMLASYGRSILWQCARRSTGLAALAKQSVRAYRSIRSAHS